MSKHGAETIFGSDNPYQRPTKEQVAAMRSALAGKPARAGQKQEFPKTEKPGKDLLSRREIREAKSTENLLASYENDLRKLAEGKPTEDEIALADLRISGARQVMQKLGGSYPEIEKLINIVKVKFNLESV